MDNHGPETEYKEEIDVSTFIGDIAHQLTLLGDSLRALAADWYQPEVDEYVVMLEMGVELAKRGRHLLALRNELCNTCQIKVVAEVLKFYPRGAAKGKRPDSRDNYHMQKILEVVFNGRVSSFTATRIDRSKLYGSKKRITVDAQGQECSNATDP